MPLYEKAIEKGKIKVCRSDLSRVQAAELRRVAEQLCQGRCCACAEMAKWNSSDLTFT